MEVLQVKTQPGLSLYLLNKILLSLTFMGCTCHSNDSLKLWGQRNSWNYGQLFNIGATSDISIYIVWFWKRRCLVKGWYFHTVNCDPGSWCQNYTTMQPLWMETMQGFHFFFCVNNNNKREAYTIRNNLNYLTLNDSSSALETINNSWDSELQKQPMLFSPRQPDSNFY